MRSKNGIGAPAIRPPRNAETPREVSTNPTDTLSAIAEMITRHPDEMLRIVRRWMDEPNKSSN